MSVLSSIKRDLHDLGFKADFKTQPELWSWLRRTPLVFSVPLLKVNDELKLWTTSVGTNYTEFETAMKGNYGTIILALRESSPLEDSKYCFIKTSETHDKTLLVEGILQTLAHSVLLHAGFPKAVPKVLDICAHPTKGTVLVLERIHGSKMLAEYLSSNIQWGCPSHINDILLMSILVQVASYVAVLEKELGMNHRDLKGTNVLMIVPSEKPIVTQTTLDVHQWEITSSAQTILIDFGFSCIGRPSGETVVSAGEFLPETDFCPKEGRDLFLFLASLWNLEHLRNSLTSKAKGLFQEWLRDNTQGTSWSDWLTSAVGTESDSLLSMYLLTSSSRFASSSCTPINILKSVSRVYPEVCQIKMLRRPGTPIT
jgi:serine/threonine protein kinase